MSLDLNSLESIGKCSDELKSSTDKIDILVNNAGVMAIPNKETTLDGFEKQIGINHLGHFALTGQLFSHLKKSGNARVVNVASSAHQFSKIDRGDLMLDKKGAYQAWLAYGNSKLANILFTKELTKKLYLKSDANVAVLCCHPGSAILKHPDPLPSVSVAIETS
jgi:NAD(P)-dependent dehydrogenase (short-subunit alcohol dehydrogenase family)